jgi:hypothetical protein
MSELREYRLRIDVELFRRQQQLLMTVINAIDCDGGYKVKAADEQDLLDGVLELLEIIDTQFPERQGDCLPQPEAERPKGSDNRRRCDCEWPGFFHSGVPGILAHMKNGRLAEGAVVNRCDLCQRYPSDEAAFERLRELGHVPP